MLGMFSAAHDAHRSLHVGLYQFQKPAESFRFLLSAWKHKKKKLFAICSPFYTLSKSLNHKKRKSLGEAMYWFVSAHI